MNPLDRRELEFLARTRARPCVSILLPTHRAGSGIREDAIRLKNLAKQAESRLRETGIRAARAREILSPIRQLTERNAFWRFQEAGLALFVTEGVFHYFRVPIALEEVVSVGERFEVSPILPLFLAGGAYYVLALSRNRVRFFVGTPSELIEHATVPGVPSSEDEALNYDVRESVLQVHTGTGAHGAAHLRGRSGKEAAVFTGQGVGVDDEKERTIQFVLQVERGVRRALRDREGPLVLAAVDELISSYRAANKYPRLLDEAVPGNPDLLRADELHVRVWPIVQRYFDADRQKALARYQDVAATGKRSDDLKQILFSAYQGRVESAFLASGTHKWGTFELEDNELDVHDEPHAGDEDLLNVAAVETILTRGTVYTLPPGQVPGGNNLAAIFRY